MDKSLIFKYENLVEFREEMVEDLWPWLWTKTDTGAWIGPKSDWENSHVKIIKSLDIRRTVIQAGGNQGMYPRLLRKYFDRVYTFEPDDLNFFCLTQNCQDEHIYKYQAFLGDHHDSYQVHRFSVENTGMHKVEEVSGEVPMLLIDDFALQSVDLIWLDIEGYELKALKGAQRTISQYKPLLMLENAEGQDIKDFLAGFGYQLTEKSVSDSIYKYRP